MLKIIKHLGNANQNHKKTYTIHKNKLKIYKRLKYKLQYHKSPRGERR